MGIGPGGRREPDVAIQGTNSRGFKKKEKGEEVAQRRPAAAKQGASPDADPTAIASLPALRSAKARFIDPMKAKLVEEPPTRGDWIYELKFDGIRLIVVKRHDTVSLFSRNQNELSKRLPEIVEAIRA